MPISEIPIDWKINESHIFTNKESVEEETLFCRAVVLERSLLVQIRKDICQAV